MESIKLDRIELKNNRVDYFFTPSKGLRKFFDKEWHMFVEYDTDISNVPISILAIPFVANIMPLMWITDSVLWLEEIDRSYYDSIPKIKYAYQEMYSKYKLKGTVVTAKTINNKYIIQREAAQLFSGGLDAMATCIRISDKKPLLINIYGWYSKDIEPNKVFDSDKKNISEFALRNEFESKFVKSNFARFIISRAVDRTYGKKLKDSWWHGLQHGMAFIGLAIPLSYKYGVENLYIASSFTLGERHICSSDPSVDIEIKYASGGVVHDGFELTRQDKIRLVVDKQKKINSDYPLRVCSFNDKNCCKCEKCFRTILGLIAEGADISKFEFNIEGDLLSKFKEYLKKDIKFFPPTKILGWNNIKNRMATNLDNIIEIELVEWLLNYDLKKEKRKALLKYRVFYFFPILKRKISNIFKMIKLQMAQKRGQV
ncbi:hypothetical protein [Clostridium sp.]|uniref:hypothetical protein n=1 Tax=Clostridium sp. TaxID=1506 RepID=UPI0032171D3C